MFEVEDSIVVWANRSGVGGFGVGGFGDGLLDIGGDERGEGSVKGVIVVKGSDEFSSQFVRFMAE